MSEPAKNSAPQEPEEFPLLPDFCNARVVLLTVITAELLAFVLVLAPDVTRRDRWINLALVSFFIQWIALFNVVVLCLARRILQKMSTTLAAISSYLLVLVVTFVASVVALWFSPTYGVNFSMGSIILSDFMLRSMTISAIVSAVALRYLYVQHQWKQNVEAEARSRIQALQARIRPHFLFNSMNTIASLTRVEPKLAEKAVEDLADLFRASMMEETMIKLTEELEFTRRYINIEKLRLGERLTVEWELDEQLATGETEVPALTLQPLVENAIYHGIEPHAEGGVVDIAVARRNGALTFRISNPIPTTRGNQRRPGNQIAQDNVQQRLKLAYGESATMDIKQTEDRYTVRFTIPNNEVQA